MATIKSRDDNICKEMSTHEVIAQVAKWRLQQCHCRPLMGMARSDSRVPSPVPSGMGCSGAPTRELYLHCSQSVESKATRFYNG